MNVAVIGCGSAGPAAALFLHRAGHTVRLFERVAELGAVGAGFMLQPTGLDVLQELGLLDRVLAHGAVVPRLYCRTRRGRRLLDLHYAEVRAGYYGVGMHRATLLDILTTALDDDGIELCLGCSIDDIVVAGGAATLVSGEERHGPFDLVVVCDGARSRLRERFGPRHRADRYPWGALWHIGADREGRFDGRLFQVVEGSRRMIGFLPTGTTTDAATTPLVSFFYSVELARVKELRAAGLEAWKREVLRIAPEAEPLLEHIGDFDDLTLAAYMDVRMKPWHVGPVVFIGDSAHATSPQLGQGVNLALVDARVLAACVTEHGEVAAALAAYDRARRRHLAYYQLATRWLTPLFQSRSRVLGWMRDLGFPISQWLGPMRRRMVRTMCGVDRGIVRRAMPLPRLALPPSSADES